jgi:hypothetical protein
MRVPGTNPPPARIRRIFLDPLPLERPERFAIPDAGIYST